MHLMVHTNGSKYWRLQYRFGGKQKMLASGMTLRQKFVGMVLEQWHVAR
ncbi:Arm DNA-binding domain-containing protein [Providencia alcalifaciens]